MNPIIESSVVFFTATILDWKKLLEPEKYKQIIVDSLAFLVKENRVKVFAFSALVGEICSDAMPSSRSILYPTSTLRNL